MRVRSGTLSPGVTLAGLVAGPLFLLFAALNALYMELPRPVTINLQDIGIFLWMLMPATVIGAILGLPINAIGGNLLALIGRRLPAVRSKLSWILVGGTIGLAAAVLLDMQLEGGVPFTLTSAVCAGICSRWNEWVEG